MSLLTRTAPHIWLAGVALAKSLTGVEYRPKEVTPAGIVYPCYSSNYVPWVPPKPKTEEEQRRDDERIERESLDEDILKKEKEIEHIRNIIERKKREIVDHDAEIDKAEKELEELRNRRKKLGPPTRRAARLGVFVPTGAMEWLLHETGHWVAATSAERALPNYGLPASEETFGVGAERELQAWAFEEIVLAPWGPARSFAPPSQRDGVGFAHTGPLREDALRHVERAIAAEHIDLDKWRSVYGDWIRWGKPLKRLAPWNAEN